MSLIDSKIVRKMKRKFEFLHSMLYRVNISILQSTKIEQFVGVTYVYQTITKNTYLIFIIIVIKENITFQINSANW